MVSVDSHTAGIKRRDFLAVTGTGLAGAMAGCLGDDEEAVLEFASFPVDVDGIVLRHIMNRTDILEEEMDDVGYDIDVTLSFDATPLFAAGTVDVATFGCLEAARFAVNDDMESVIAAKQANSYTGWLVRAGSEWAPSQTGSLEASINKIADEGQMGEAGWGLGHVPTFQVIMEEQFGLQYEEGGDFDVVIANFGALPTLVADGDLDAAPNSPSHGAASFMVDEVLEPLFWGHDLLMETGIGLPPLTGIGTRKEFYDEHGEAVDALVRAIDRGHDWFFENGADEIPEDDEYLEVLGTDDSEIAEYIVEWQQHEDVLFGTEYPPRLQDITFDDELVQNELDYLNAVQDAGLLESGWEDLVHFEQVN